MLTEGHKIYTEHPFLKEDASSLGFNCARGMIESWELILRKCEKKASKNRHSFHSEASEKLHGGN